MHDSLYKQLHWAMACLATGLIRRLAVTADRSHWVSHCMVMQPAPEDVATLLHPKYKANSGGTAAHSNGASLPASLQLEHAVAAARAFNQVEAAAASFSGRQSDSTTGIFASTTRAWLSEQQSLSGSQCSHTANFGIA